MQGKTVTSIEKQMISGIIRKGINSYSAHSFSFPEFWLSTIFNISDLFSSRYCIIDYQIRSSKITNISCKNRSGKSLLDEKFKKYSAGRRI